MTCPSEAPRLIFVGGLHRSGTTIVARTLETHPSVAGFRGTGVPEHEGQLLQDVYPPAWVHGGPGVFAFHPAAHLTEETPGAGRRAGRRLLAAWAPYWDHSRPVVVEKSPPNLIRTRFLQAAFPDACFVLVVRHPAIVALRTQRFRPGQGQGLVELIRHWTRAHDIFASDRPLLRNACVVWYEAFVDDPSAVLADVASRVGITAEFDVSCVDASRSDGVFDHWLSIRPTIDAVILQELANDVSRHGYLLDCPRPIALPAGDGD